MPERRDYKYFRPKRMASWWCTLEDILWPEKKIVDKIKRRAEGFAKAGIDTAINFGFHTRFDYSNYFGSLHGYYANVCEELHKYGIKYMDHYTCNLIERPRNENEFKKLHSMHRHHILLHPDPIAAAHAQYEGHKFQDICEVDVRDGSRGYTWAYQAEIFCHNNPEFLDMHRKYLERLISEVPLDGIQVDDMCDYSGLTTCACKHCRERFLKDYGHELPPFEDKDFWGDTSGSQLTWGNYENPVFRDWLRMREDSVSDHVKMVKSIVGDIPLMTCCSSTGPMILNALSLNLERMMDHLDLVMLENCGMNIHTVDWHHMDAEALQQKDIAEKMGHAPAIALSYTIYDAGAYLGWCLSRFWGVGNWSSTLTGRLIEEPEDASEIHEIIEPINNWEIKYSDLDIENGKDVAEVRLVSSRLCKENGWRDENGLEHWNRVCAWSNELLENNIGYRFVRADELADAKALKSESTPIIMDGVGCVSDSQHNAIKDYLENGGKAWICLPFGTHDGKGFKRAKPLSEELLAMRYKGLTVLDGGANTIKNLVDSGLITPRIRQLSGDARWAVRLRVHPEGVVMHLMSRAIEAVPHLSLKDISNTPILADIESVSSDNKLEFTIDFNGIGDPWQSVGIMSPELGDERRIARIERISDKSAKVSVDLTGVMIYAVVK